MHNFLISATLMTAMDVTRQHYQQAFGKGETALVLLVACLAAHIYILTNH